MIPKIIFQTWFTRNIHPSMQSQIDRMLKLNPEYEYRLFTDEDMDNFVNEHFPGEISDCYNRLNIIVAKVDLWRYLVLYHHGGVYLDMDSSIIGRLSELIQETDEAIISEEGNPYTYLQWAMVFSKGHPILKCVIDIVVDNIKTNRFPNDIHRMTGPTAYTQGINKIHEELFGYLLLHPSNSNIDRNAKFSIRGISYRFFGVDYPEYFVFKHADCSHMYVNRKNWNEEQRVTPLLKP